MIEINLSFPPSTNDIWAYGARNVRMGGKYLKWQTENDKLVMAQRLRFKTIMGAFTSEIILDEYKYGGFDLDNGIKAILDYCQRIDAIENDKFNRRLLVEWGKTTYGCKVILKPWENSAQPKTPPTA